MRTDVPMGRQTSSEQPARADSRNETLAELRFATLVREHDRGSATSATGDIATSILDAKNVWPLQPNKQARTPPKRLLAVLAHRVSKAAARSEQSDITPSGPAAKNGRLGGPHRQTKKPLKCLIRVRTRESGKDAARSAPSAGAASACDARKGPSTQPCERSETLNQGLLASPVNETNSRSTRDALNKTTSPVLHPSAHAAPSTHSAISQRQRPAAN